MGSNPTADTQIFRERAFAAAGKTGAIFERRWAPQSHRHCGRARASFKSSGAQWPNAPMLLSRLRQCNEQTCHRIRARR